MLSSPIVDSFYPPIGVSLCESRTSSAPLCSEDPYIIMKRKIFRFSLVQIHRDIVLRLTRITVLLFKETAKGTQSPLIGEACLAFNYVFMVEGRVLLKELLSVI